MILNEPSQIEAMLRGVFAELHESRDPGFERRREEFVFHMMDWIGDLRGLTELMSSSSSSNEVAARQIVGFLHHVIPHINAAGRLLLGVVPDPFHTKSNDEVK